MKKVLLSYATFGVACMALAAPIKVAVAAVPGAAAGSSYPTKPVTIIVENAAGSQADLLGRVVAQALGKQLGQTVIVENRPGASGFIAAKATATANADGYTVMLGSSGVMAITPHVYSNVPYDALKDFVAVSDVASAPSVFVVPTSHSARTLPEFVSSQSKDAPTLNFGTLGTGSTSNIVSQVFGRSAKLKVTEIAYKSEPAIITDLVAARLDFAILPIASTVSYIRSGKLKPLAVTAKTRTRFLQDVPATPESPYGDVQMVQWFGLFAPAATPSEVVVKLASAAEKALADPDTRQRITELGIEPGQMNQRQFVDFFKAQFDEYGRTVKALGIKVD